MCVCVCVNCRCSSFVINLNDISPFKVSKKVTITSESVNKN